MSTDKPQTPDDAMIKSWITSLELFKMSVQSAVSYQDHLNHLDGIEPDNELTPDEIYLQHILDAKKALKALLHE